MRENYSYSRASHHVRSSISSVNRMISYLNEDGRQRRFTVSSAALDTSDSSAALDTSESTLSDSASVKVTNDPDGSDSGSSAPQGEGKLHPAAAYVNLTFPLKIMVSFVQITTNLGGLAAIQWPRYPFFFSERVCLH